MCPARLRNLCHPSYYHIAGQQGCLDKVPFQAHQVLETPFQSKFTSSILIPIKFISNGWLIAGEFVSRRSFESIWASDACVYNCLAHSIFNLTSPKSSAGVFAVNDTAKVVDVRVVNTSSNVDYMGHDFGCQRIPSNQVSSTSLLTCYALSLPCFNAWTHTGLGQLSMQTSCQRQGSFCC